MSDEPTPPSLRLKPRQTPVAPAAPTPVAPATEPASADPLAESDPLRLRIKPKAPPPEGSGADTAGGTFATPVPFSSPPMPRAGGDLSPIEPPTSAQIGAAPIPVVPSPPMPPPQVRPPKPQHVPTPRGLADPSAPHQKKSPPSAIKADKWLAGAVLFVLVLVAAFYGVRYLMKAHPKPTAQASAPTSATTPVAPSAPAQNPPKLVEHPTSAAGKTIAQARDAVAAHDKREKEQGVTSILEEPAVPAAAQASVGTGGATATAAVTPEVASAASVEPSPPPSEAFRQFVVNLRVNGVFQGEPARALINGKMRYLGDVLEPNRGIKLHKIDTEAKQLIFQDFTGAIMSRRY